MTPSIAQAIANSEDLLRRTHRQRGNTREAFNNILSTYIDWPYQIRSASATDIDGRKTDIFPTLIYTATEKEPSPEPVSISAESLACAIEVVDRLDLDSLQKIYQKVATAKSLRKTTGPQVHT